MEQQDDPMTTKQVVEEDVDDQVEFTQLLNSRRKKKRKKNREHEEGPEDKGQESPTQKTLSVGQGDDNNSVWASTCLRDYSYMELLDRLYTTLRTDHPVLAAGTTAKRYSLTPPMVSKVGTKRIMWANFASYCTTFHRSHEHMQTFMIAEMGTEGALDAHKRLVVKGRYTPTQLEALLKKYVNEYVKCHTCSGLDTTLTRDRVTRLHFVICDSCTSRRSVSSISTGFRATNRADRRKTQAAAAAAAGTGS